MQRAFWASTFIGFASLLASTTGFAQSGKLENAIFAGGCFWCMEEAFEKLPGVREVESGYSQGNMANPDYRSVSMGKTGHTEVIRVSYDPAIIDYNSLLEHFWKNIDPTVKDQQFCDKGDQYRSGIYYLNETQKKAANESLTTLANSGRFEKIYTEIEAADTFYIAEEYHQDYYKKNPWRYKLYKNSCGRVNRLAEVWGK